MSGNLQQLDKLVTNGKPNFGVFDRVEQVNYLDYDSYKISGKAVAAWRKKLRANQFCFIQISQPPYRICFAVATLNWVTSSFCYFYNEDTQQFDVIEALQPFTRNTQFNQSTYQGVIKFSSRKLSISLDFTVDTVQVCINSHLLSLQADIARPYSSLAVCTPTGKTGWTYTQKEPMLLRSGQLSLEQSKTEQSNVGINLQNATATLDWSLGYMRRVTNWYWASITSYLANGQYLVLNLAMGVNESGSSENACWLDGERFHLPAVLFERSNALKGDELRSDESLNAKLKNNWIISNQALNWSTVKIELSFTPLHCYQKNDRFILVDSIFEQWIGYYSGYIDLDFGLESTKRIKIDKVMGLAEDHYAKW